MRHWGTGAAEPNLGAARSRGGLSRAVGGIVSALSAFPCVALTAVLEGRAMQTQHELAAVGHRGLRHLRRAHEP
jgi:hypothetical protein